MRRFVEAGEPSNTRPARSKREPWQGQKKPPGQSAPSSGMPCSNRDLGRQPRCVQVPSSTRKSLRTARVGIRAYSGCSESAEVADP